MEKNYNIRFNLEEPSKEAIRKRMDFDALLNQFEESQPAPAARPAKVRRLVYVLSAAAAAIALLLLIPVLTRQQSTLSPEAYFAQQHFVAPPIGQLSLDFQKESITDPHKGGIIEYPSGSRLVVPAAAFMTDRGALVGGEVEVFYRELHDYVDFFVAGIPMAYDSLGTQRYLTSAGMVEVYAEQNGKRLQLAPGKAIQVELVSEVPVNDYFTLPNYYIYQLDTAARSWVYRNVDMLQFVAEDNWPDGDTGSPEALWKGQLAQLETEYQQSLQELQDGYPLPPAPLMPTQAKGDRPTLELDFLNGDIALDAGSDLQAEDLAYLHQGTIWEIAPESPAVDPRAFRVTWESVRLRRLNAQRFELTLVHSQNEETIIVTPVLLGANYERAMIAYEAARKGYDAATQAREEYLIAGRESLQAAFNLKKKALQEELSQEIQNLNQPLTRKVVNRFVVNTFGVWNCAQPINAPRTITGVNYVDDAGTPIENVTAYVVNPRQNTVYRYLANNKAPLGVPDDESLLWIVKDDGNISISTLEEGQTKEGEVQLKTVAPPVKSSKELRKLLSL